MAKGKKTGGRKKGTQNRHTIVVKDAVLETLANLGGAEGMTRWARRNKGQFYRIAARLIPQEMRAEITGPGGEAIPHEHTHTGNVSVTGRIDALAAAFESAADRAGAGGVPGDGAGQPVDPGRDQGGQHTSAS